jgi:hypothetical protein
MQKIIILAVLFVSLVLLANTVSGCGSGSSLTPSTVSLFISPTTVTLSEAETQQFTATVTGTSQTAVAWSVTGCTGTACGTISATGLYTAPFDIPNNATVTVVATLESDPTKSAGATVNHVPPNITRGEAQGVYSGTSFYGVDGLFYSIVLPNDTFYAFYQDLWGEGLSNMMTGQGKSTSGTFTASLTNYYEGGALTAKLTATYVPGTSMTGSIVLDANGFTTKFDATALPSSLFEWDTPANLAHITGTWQGITINPDGTFTGRYGDCKFSGTIAPDSSNKNFFNVTITYGGAPCPANMANQTGSGIAIETLLSDGITRHLLAGAPVGDWRCVIAARR